LNIYNQTKHIKVISTKADYVLQKKIWKGCDLLFFYFGSHGSYMMKKIIHSNWVRIIEIIID